MFLVPRTCLSNVFCVFLKNRKNKLKSMSFVRKYTTKEILELYLLPLKKICEVYLMYTGVVSLYLCQRLTFLAFALKHITMHDDLLKMVSVTQTSEVSCI